MIETLLIVSMIGAALAALPYYLQYLAVRVSFAITAGKISAIESLKENYRGKKD